MTSDKALRKTIAKDDGKKSDTIRFLLTGSALSAAYWLFESFTHTFLFHTDGLFENILTKSPHELWMRSVTVLVIWLALMTGHRLKKRLVESERSRNVIAWKKRLFDEQIEELVVYYDENFDISWANGAAARSLNMTPDEMIGKKCYALWHDSSSPCKGCPVQKSIETRTPQKNMITTPDGRFWFIRGYPDIDESGKVVGSFELTLELTALKQTENRLSEEKEKLESILRSVEEGILTADKLGNITYMNGAFARITGWTREEAVGNSIMRLLILHDKATDRKIIPPLNKILTITEGKSINHRGTLKTKEGETKLVSVSFSAILGTEGEAAGIVVMLKDITEIEERFSHLFEARKFESLGAMARGMANALKSIHQPASTEISLLRSMFNDNAGASRSIAVLEEIFDREDKLAEELMSLSKGPAPKPEKVALPAMIREITSNTINSTECNVTQSMDKGLWPVHGDRSQIEYVITELLKFIKVAARRGCLIEISARNERLESSNPYELPAGKYVLIRVSSDSYFITKDRTDRIFDPFFSQFYTDNGLELARIRSIVAAHNGFIGITSLPETGTSFRIILRAATEASGKTLFSKRQNKENAPTFSS
ncbi:MAG: hypothetical protein B6D63_06465 [Candidatus Latescibacteria bacterium 4484_7]|nr:MAG: hypothetical protein B6D63_06465 [Candidatus Latescibacteria bacterium 4484_7]